jgi:hypothetical protein
MDRKMIQRLLILLFFGAGIIAAVLLLTRYPSPEYHVENNGKNSISRIKLSYPDESFISGPLVATPKPVPPPTVDLPINMNKDFTLTMEIQYEKGPTITRRIQVTPGTLVEPCTDVYFDVADEGKVEVVYCQPEPW